jgi:hypothetical protein
MQLHLSLLIHFCHILITSLSALRSLKYNYFNLLEDTLCVNLGRCLKRNILWPSTVSCIPRLQDGELGRAIAQAVSRRLPTAWALVQNRVLSCGIL